MTGYSSLPVALEAIKKGANTFLTKPFHVPHLKELVKKALSLAIITLTWPNRDNFLPLCQYFFCTGEKIFWKTNVTYCTINSTLL